MARDKSKSMGKEERRKKSLIERLIGLIEGCDTAIALLGGAGHVDRDYIDVESHDRESFAPEASNTGRAWLAVHIRPVLQGILYLYAHTSARVVILAEDVKTAVEKIS